MGANLHSLIYNVSIDIVFPILLLLVNSKKNTRWGWYAQHKGISYFNSTSTVALKIDQSRKLG